MAEMIPAQVHQDIEDIGKAVNTDSIITPRYGAPFKSIPMIAREAFADIMDLRANKANKTEVENALSEKASKSEVYSKEEVIAVVAPKADREYVDNALTGFTSGAAKFYPTLAEANADIANLSVNQVVNIGEIANGGLWYKATAEATTLTKSVYDPLTQANNRMDANPLFKPFVLSTNSDFNNLPTSGYFIVNANASSILNMPEQSNGFGFESTDSLGNKTQWYISQPLNNFWFRTKWNGVWKDWKKNADATQVIPVTSQKTGAQTLASYENQGKYNFASTATISDLPSDAPTGVSYTLTVEDYLSGDRFKIQYLRCDSAKTGLKWERSLDKQNHTVGTWILTPRLHDAQIIADNLSASFRYKGSFTSVSISDYKSDGLYTFITPTDAPVGASGTSFVVDVQNWFNGTMVVQTCRTWAKPDEIFTQMITSAGPTGWKIPGGASGSSVFAGKKIVCFGDSITEFGTYPTQMANRLGATGYNIGFGGCRWGKHSNALYDEMCMYKVADYIATDNLTGLMNAAIALRDSSQADDNTAQVARLQSLDLSTVDYVTIFHGTNDFQGLVPIGTDSDATGDTFKGAINLSLDKLLTKYPNMKLLLVTPIWRARQVNGDDLESDNNPNSLGLYLRDYVEAIKDMGKKYHVPVLDLYNNSGIGKYTKNLYLSSDELHPNTVGYTHLANLIAAKLSSTY